MTHKLMLDSGAFSVWSKGKTIDLEEYIAFCVAHPHVSYYVALDVIPGVFGKKMVGNADAYCEQGWQNYQHMLKSLPIEKVIPVFHQGDDYKWLDRFLSFGTPYVGISPSNDRSLAQKVGWLRETRKYLEGKRSIKTHGFGFVSHKLLHSFPFYSVDSATWMYRAAMGEIWVPRRKGADWDYVRPPFQIGISGRHYGKGQEGCHLETSSVSLRRLIIDYVQESGRQLGESKFVTVGSGYKLKPEEIWSKKGSLVEQVIIRGVTNSLTERLKCNVFFLRNMTKFLPIRDFYFAGNPNIRDAWFVERLTDKRLLSYAFLNNKAGRTVFKKHCNRIEIQEEANVY